MVRHDCGVKKDQAADFEVRNATKFLLVAQPAQRGPTVLHEQDFEQFSPIHTLMIKVCWVLSRHHIDSVSLRPGSQSPAPHFLSLSTGLQVHFEVFPPDTVSFRDELFSQQTGPASLAG
jgi:hypothetical protein